MRIVCLISGGGSNLQALIDWQKKGLLGNAKLVAVASNVADAKGLRRAKKAGIPSVVQSHNNYPDRKSFDLILANAIDIYEPDLLALAGFMRILSPDFISAYSGRLINIHPSLLPKYKGLNTHARALEAGDSEAGATVHWVTEELDGGEIIRQSKVPIIAGDTEKTLKARVLKAEHSLYPSVIRDLSLGEVKQCTN